MSAVSECVARGFRGDGCYAMGGVFDAWAVQHPVFRALIIKVMS